MRYSRILLEGEEIKRVGNGYGAGIINLPKVLIGRFVKISLLSKEEEKEITKKYEQVEKFREEIVEQKEKLKQTLGELFILEILF
jgi:hypothetical protein